MPLRAVRADLSLRLTELRTLHRLIVRNEANLPVPAEHATLKGLFIVNLYGYLEYSVGRIITVAVAHINAKNVQFKHLSHDVYTMAASANFMSAADTRGERKWLKRHEVITSQLLANTCNLPDNVLAQEIQNTRVTTIELMFTLFSVRADTTVDATTARFINEIGERRNAVAHGRESAADVGGRFTAAALGDRLNKFEQQTTHMILSFEGMLNKRSYIKPNCRRIYPP